MHWGDYLQKLRSFLKPTGRLIVVLREQDDPYKFKIAFKPLLFNNPAFKALTTDDVLKALPEGVMYTKYFAESELKIPLDNPQDTIAIIEFYLNKPWDEIPKDMQHDIQQFIKSKRGLFKQIDSIAVIPAAAEWRKRLWYGCADWATTRALDISNFDNPTQLERRADRCFRVASF